MECVIERSCGLDVHKKTVTAWVRVPGANGAHEQHVRTFGTTAADYWRCGTGLSYVELPITRPLRAHDLW